MGKKRRKIVKGKREGGKGGKLKMEGGKSSKMRRRPFFLFFFVVGGFFVFITFQNDENLFWVYQNRNFLLGKSISRREKIRKNDFAPSEKLSCYAPV